MTECFQSLYMMQIHCVTDGLLSDTSGAVLEEENTKNVLLFTIKLTYILCIVKNDGRL